MGTVSHVLRSVRSGMWLCMCACGCVCVSACVRACVYVCTHDARMPVCIRTRICMYMCTYVHLLLSWWYLFAGDPAVPPSTSTMSAAAMAGKRSGNRRRLNRRRHKRRAARSSVRRRQMAAVDSNSGRDAMNGRAGRPRDERLEEEQTYFNVSVYQYIRPVKNRRIRKLVLLVSECCICYI